MSPRSPTRSPACKIVFNGKQSGRRRHLPVGADLGRAGRGDEPVPPRQRRTAARRSQSAAVSHGADGAGCRASATSPSAETRSPTRARATTWSPDSAHPTSTTWSATCSSCRRRRNEHARRATSRTDHGVPGMPDRRSRRRILRAVRCPPDRASAETARTGCDIRDLRRRSRRAPAAAVVGQFAVPAAAAPVPHRVPGRPDRRAARARHVRDCCGCPRR